MRKQYGVRGQEVEEWVGERAETPGVETAKLVNDGSEEKNLKHHLIETLGAKNYTDFAGWEFEATGEFERVLWGFVAFIHAEHDREECFV